MSFWRWLKRLFGGPGYDLAGKPYNRPYFTSSYIDVRSYIQPGSIPQELIGRDWRDIYDYLQQRLVYKTDREQFGRLDKWLMPGEYMRGGWAGDCEDSALWLVSALEANGYGGDYRMVLGCHGDYWKRRKLNKRINHAWVMIRTGRWLVLETTSRGARPIRADKTWQYLPRMSFDMRQVWEHKA